MVLVPPGRYAAGSSEVTLMLPGLGAPRGPEMVQEKLFL